MYLIFGLGFAAFVFSLILTPLIRDGLGRFGLVDRPDGGRKRHAGPIPRVGGIAIALAYVASFGVMLALPFSYGSEVSMALPNIWKLFWAAGLVLATGLFDDLVGYFPWQKLVGQIWAATIAYFAGVQIHFFADNPWQLWWNIPLSILWLVGCMNAFNLIDGLDGLAAGVGLFATITMLLAAFANHNLQLALVTMPLAGALIGFLRYNFNPASVFLGDCGSLLIGFLLGCYGVLWSQKSATLLGMTAPLMALAIPLLDAGLSIIRRFLRHQPIFGADHGHIHHMLLARGLTVRKVALLLYTICGIGAALSLTLDALQNEFAGLIVVLFCVSAWIGIQHLGYTEFAAARQLIVKGTFRRIIDYQTKLNQFERELQECASLADCWTQLVAGSRDFGFHSVRMMVNSKVFETVITPDKRGPFWQMRIPLMEWEYINFNRDVGGDPMTPLMVGGFADMVGRVLPSKILEFAHPAETRSLPISRSAIAGITSAETPV
jgi:UDP-GlcNAc:undecaprenyl-phosphate GlcNAc-1-phosphate transferase